MESGLLPIPVREVIYQNLAEGAVLLLPADEVYFGLNEVGSLIWSLLPPATATFDELCDALCARYPEVQRSTIEQDTRELLEELAAQKLIAFGTTGEGASNEPPGQGP